MVCAFVNMVGLQMGGLTNGWAYIWNGLSFSKHGGLILGGGGGGIVGGLRYNNMFIMCIFQGHITCLFITKSVLSI